MDESLTEQLTRLHEYLENAQGAVWDALELSTDSYFIEAHKWAEKLSECCNIVDDVDIGVKQLLDKWKIDEKEEDTD